MKSPDLQPKQLDGIYDDRRVHCQGCQSVLLPANETDYQTVRGFYYSIHAAGDYVIEIRCGDCWTVNRIKRKGLTRQQLNEILKSIA